MESSAYSNKTIHHLNLDDPHDLMKIQGKYYQMSNEQRLAMLEKEQEFNALEQIPNDPMHPGYYIIYTNTLPPE